MEAHHRLLAGDLAATASGAPPPDATHLGQSPDRTAARVDGRRNRPPATDRTHAGPRRVFTDGLRALAAADRRVGSRVGTRPYRAADRRSSRKRSVRECAGERGTVAKKKRAARKVGKTKSPRKRQTTTDVLLTTVKGATHRYVGHVRLDVGRAGAARVKRMIYPAGFRWSTDMKPVVGTDLCMHAHVGFLARGEIHIEYADGCVVEHKPPQIVAIEPGHDGWVVGKEPVVLIEFDFEGDTVNRLGMPDAHRH